MACGVPLRLLFAAPQVYHNGAWGLHHEQVEMVENCWGQYEHNNQPVWHMLWMAAPAGCPEVGAGMGGRGEVGYGYTGRWTTMVQIVRW